MTSRGITIDPTMNLFAILDHALHTHPSRKAVVCGAQSLTYTEFARRARGVAHFLKEEGIGPGGAVAMLHRNCHLMLEAYFGAAAAGALFVPLNTRLSPAEIALILTDSAARVLIAEPLFEKTARAALDTLRPEARPRLVASHGPSPNSLENRIGKSRPAPHSPAAGGGSDTAHLYYTSGTTGRPKGVILTHANVASHAAAAIESLEITDEDVWLHAAPLFHLADAWATWAITWAGGCHVILPEFDGSEVFDTIAAERVTITNLIPTMLNRLVHHEAADRLKLKSMRRIMSGGAPMALDLLEKIEALFPCEYVQTYGLTETSPFLTLSLPTDSVRSMPAAEQRRYRAMTGRPMNGVEVKVVDREGRSVPCDGRTVGQIVARGPWVTPGYFKRPEETAHAFRDGWFHTGDLAHVEAEGYLTIVDRIKDVINTGGELVYSTEVENALFAHPAVREAAVFAAPDAEWGEAVMAAVVVDPTETARPDDLIAFCRGRLAAYKVPSRVELVDRLPRTGSGKIDKKALREPWWRGRERRVH